MWYLVQFCRLILVRRPSFVRQRGATLIEYALIISAIALVVLLGSLSITGDLTSFFDTAGSQLDGTGGGG